MERFRLYASAEVELSPGCNLVCGRNAQGKTTLLEAINLLSTGRTLRGQRDSEVVKLGEERCMVVGVLHPTETELGVEVPATGRKRALLNGLPLPRPSDLLGRLPSVRVTAVDLALARGEPADRRTALDLDLSSLYPAYLRSLSVYKRALEQRNALLRMDDPSHTCDGIDVWDEKLAEHGAVLRKMRFDYIESLTAAAAEVQANLGGGERLAMSYAAKDDGTDRESLLQTLRGARREDLARGTTTVGPHRDDFVWSIDGKDVRLFGSQGQQRSAVIGWKLASLGFATRVLGFPPLLLLDDMFSDLDAERRERLVQVLIDCGAQSVLTCTERDAAGPRILERARVFEVEAGNVSLVSS